MTAIPRPCACAAPPPPRRAARGGSRVRAAPRGRGGTWRPPGAPGRRGGTRPSAAMSGLWPVRVQIHVCLPVCIYVSVRLCTRTQVCERPQTGKSGCASKTASGFVVSCVFPVPAATAGRQVAVSACCRRSVLRCGCPVWVSGTEELLVRKHRACHWKGMVVIVIDVNRRCFAE